MHPGHALGSRAESAVVIWLVSCGWLVQRRRYRSAAGEIDIVAIDPSGVQVAVEVKARRSDRTGTAAESLDRRRLARLRRCLSDYWHEIGAGAPIDRRVDLVTVEPTAQEGVWRVHRTERLDGW